MKKRVIVAGHICLDINPVFSGPKVNAIGDLLKPGKLVQVGAAAFNTGGAVANTGLAMKVLGANVSLMGKIGRDSFGDTVMGILRQYGAEDGMIVSEDASTSYTIVIAPPGIDRIFLHDPAANNTFCADDIDEKALADAALFHFGYPSVMQKLYENQGEGFIDMIRRVHEKGVAVSLDLCAVDPGSEAGKQDWHAILKAVLPYVDLFVPSIEELCSMLDLCHGIVIFRLENLVRSENVHFQLSFRVQFMACQCGMIRAVPVNDRIQGQCLSVCQIFVLVVQDSLFVLLHREHGKRFQKVHGAFAEVTGGASVFVPGDDSVTDVRRILIDSQAVHGSMVHPVGMMADVRKHHRLVCQTLKKLCCRTVRSHIRCGDKPRPLNDVQLRIPFDEFLYHLQMFFQCTGLV